MTQNKFHTQLGCSFLLQLSALSPVSWQLYIWFLSQCFNLGLTQQQTKISPVP